MSSECVSKGNERMRRENPQPGLKMAALNSLSCENAESDLYFNLVRVTIKANDIQQPSPLEKII